MVVKNLRHTRFEEIIRCFLKAFQNYYVNLPSDPEYFRERWRVAGIRYNFSYGMFNGEELVGFILHAIDERQGKKMAYNAGTGVLTLYRGKNIVKTLYAHALPQLKQKGISRVVLEVIKKNKRAIKAYEEVGFKIVKSYCCFQGKIELPYNISYELVKTGYNSLDWDRLKQASYSWENHHSTLKNGAYEYYQLLKDEKPEAYFVIDPADAYLAQFDVLKESENSWPRLFSGIRSVSEAVKINNVDEKLTTKLGFLQSIGLQNTVDQYEMELEL